MSYCFKDSPVTSIILVLLLSSIGCEKQNNPITEQNSEVNDTADSLRILALGDSYTIGESVTVNERWPNQLRDSLQQFDIPVKEVRIIARTGWTTGNLLSAINSQTFDYTYDLVSLLIGVNNQFQGRSINEYEMQFRELLERSIALADSNAKRVIVLSIPDYSVTPVGAQFGGGSTAQQIDAFNAVNKRLSEEYSVKYFDITPLSRTAAGQYDLVASDGLHFSGKMYALWVDYILPEVIAILKN